MVEHVVAFGREGGHPVVGLESGQPQRGDLRILRGEVATVALGDGQDGVGMGEDGLVAFQPGRLYPVVEPLPAGGLAGQSVVIFVFDVVHAHQFAAAGQARVGQVGTAVYPLEEDGGIVGQQVGEQLRRPSARDDVGVDRELSSERAVARVVVDVVGHLVELGSPLPVVLVGMQQHLVAGGFESPQFVVDVDDTPVVGREGHLQRYHMNAQRRHGKIRIYTPDRWRCWPGGTGR